MASLKLRAVCCKPSSARANTLVADAQILMRLLHGPFRNLIGEWRFDPIGTRGSRVHFRVEFEFKNRLTAAAFNSAFEALCGTIVDAFAVRAQTIYAE